ncbi:hypothetical protein E2P81_ATG03107 [Venturia nashicola]|nr:hypothetical protein E2P81_ATG03107 [Venturia nashicola]
MMAHLGASLFHQQHDSEKRILVFVSADLTTVNDCESVNASVRICLPIPTLPGHPSKPPHVGHLLLTSIPADLSSEMESAHRVGWKTYHIESLIRSTRRYQSNRLSDQRGDTSRIAYQINAEIPVESLIRSTRKYQRIAYQINAEIPRLNRTEPIPVTCSSLRQPQAWRWKAQHRPPQLSPTISNNLKLLTSIPHGFLRKCYSLIIAPYWDRSTESCVGGLRAVDLKAHHEDYPGWTCAKPT